MVPAVLDVTVALSVIDPWLSATLVCPPVDKADELGAAVSRVLTDTVEVLVEAK